MITAEELIEEGRKRLVSANERFGYKGGEEDQAWELLEHAWGRDPELEDEVPAAVRRRFARLVERRLTGEPMAYILGWTEFRDLRFGIKPGMFIPRLTSEFLAEQAIRRLRRRQAPIHADVATGIGPVAISSALAVPHASVWGLDISRKAVNQARTNAAALGAKNASFAASDMFSSLPASLMGGLDVITIHPPYVARSEVATLPHEIKGFEPRHTLTDGSRDGLGLVRRVIDEGTGWLRPGGWLLMEITPTESNAVRSMMRSAGYGDVRSTHGRMRYTRVIVARR